MPARASPSSLAGMDPNDPTPVFPDCSVCLAPATVGPGALCDKHRASALAELGGASVVDPAHVQSCPACGHSPRVQRLPNGNVSFTCLWCNHGVWGTSKAKAAECWAYFLGGQRHRAPVCLNCHNLTTNGTDSLCDPCIALG